MIIKQILIRYLVYRMTSMRRRLGCKLYFCPCRAWGSRQWLPRVTLRLPWALDFRAFSPERWNEWCTRVNCMAQGSFSVATLSLPIILYQPLNIRDYIEYGLANLIIWQLTTITQIFYKIFAYTAKVDREGFDANSQIVSRCLSKSLQ